MLPLMSRKTSKTLPSRIRRTKPSRLETVELTICIPYRCTNLLTSRGIRLKLQSLLRDEMHGKASDQVFHSPYRCAQPATLLYLNCASKTTQKIYADTEPLHITFSCTGSSKHHLSSFIHIVYTSLSLNRTSLLHLTPFRLSASFMIHSAASSLYFGSHLVNAPLPSIQSPAPHCIRAWSSSSYTSLSGHTM